MSPDDHRHGTYAGYMAHRRSGMPLCAACALAHRRYTKRAKMRLATGARNRVPLGPEAWQRLTDVGNIRAAAATGLNANRLSVIQRTGPEAVVLRATRDALLALRAPTPAGIQRRVRALIALGYSAKTIAEAADIHPSNVRILARREDVPTLVRSEFAEAICTAFDALGFQRVDADRWSTATRRRAQRKGWAPPLAWDDIDNDPQPPVDSVTVDLDEVVVARIIAGDRIAATSAERAEVVRRWLASGRSLRQLEVQTGWNTNRMINALAAATDGHEAVA